MGGRIVPSTTLSFYHSFLGCSTTENACPFTSRQINRFLQHHST